MIHLFYFYLSSFNDFRSHGNDANEFGKKIFPVSLFAMKIAHELHEEKKSTEKDSPQITHRGLRPQPKLQITKYKLQTNYNKQKNKQKIENKKNLLRTF